MAALLAPMPGSVIAADEPAPQGLTLEARALLAGHVRPGAWTAVDVDVANDGPSLSGELRVRSPQQGRSVYGIPVELPSGSRKRYTLYAQPPLFGTRVHVDLVSGGRAVLTRDVAIKSHDAYAPIIAVIAERPEVLLAGVHDAVEDLARRQFEGSAATVITLAPSDLPARVEAWSAVDRVVWQDIDPRQLSADQAEALRLWLSAGGRLTVFGGTTGIGTVSGFPADLLPFVPTGTIDVPAADLQGALGDVPVDVATVPALAGSLVRGTAWARSGDGVVAAHTGIGRGTVTLVGFNPADSWLAGTESGRALWRRVLPPAAGPQLNPLMITDDSAFVSALNNLPSIDLPPIEQLFLLLFAYVALIGPINYMVLRRLDKREWAWVTMPALVAIFAVASYGMGASLKGSDVIINEVAIVRAGEGTDRGLGQVYVGVFSPSRRTFDVRVGDGALLTNPGSQNQMGQPELPLDVLFGERSQLRNFEVGFGLLRGFRAEAPTRAPLIEADLRLARGRVEGTVTNRSDRSLEHVAISYAGGVDVLDSLAAGESKEVSIDTSDALMEYQLSERIFGSIPPRDAAQARAVYTRRTVIDQLSGYGSGASGANADAPLLMGWQPGQVLDVELVGERPNRVGDSLFLVPLSMTVDREALFTDRMLVKTVVENNSGEGFVEGTSYFLGRGAMIVEARPGALDGALAVRSLELALAQDDQIRLRGSGTPISPLPEAEQPDQDDPVGEPDDAGAGGFEDLPRFQLFDHGAQRWYEFPEAVSGSTYLINDAQRFVDPSGRVLVRLVNRDNLNEPKYFSLLMRLEGTIE